MERVDQKLLTLAQRRIESIPRMIDQSSVYRKPQSWGLKTHLMRFMGNLLIHLDRSNIEGIGNLERAEEIARGNTLIVTQNHITDLDHQGKRMVLEKVGHRSFADRLVYPSGLKMDERPYIRLFMGAEHTLFIATPADFDNVQSLLLRDKSEHFLDDFQGAMLETYRNKLKDLNKEAMRQLTMRNREGLIIALYPEATRSRHPKSYIQRAPASVALYTLPQEDEPDKYIFPIAAKGLERTLPAEKWMRFWRVLPPTRALDFMSRADLRVVFGEPYPASEIWDPRRVKALKEMGVEKADYIVAKIAVLDPDLVEPEDMKFYQRVLAA